LDLPPDWFITGPIVGGTDGLWVMVAGGGDEGDVASARLVRVDPTTNSTVATFDVEAATTFAVGSGSVWVASAYADGRTSLTRIDTGTNEPDPSVEITGTWVPFGLGADRLWLLGGNGGSSELGWSDLLAPDLQGSLPLESVPAFEGSGVVDPAADAVWVANLEDSVTKVDLRLAS
jgi:hypothetical protein